jgi:hypothetical protein
MKQYRVTINPTKKVKTKATYTVVAKDKAAAGNMALVAHRQHIGIPGFSTVPQVTEV